MKTLALSLVLSLSLPAVAADLPNMPPDNTGGRSAHIKFSAAIGAVTAELAPHNMPLAFGACFAVGVAKEVKDERRGQEGYKHGLFSRNDLRADAVGCALGLAVNKGVHLVFGQRTMQFAWEF